MDNTEMLTAGLFALQDLKYRDFHSRLVPEIPKDRIIGVRMPELRKYAVRVSKNTDCSEFLAALPHFYYDENNLHAALLAIRYRDIDKYLEELEKFLPYVDNWATCDMMGAKIFQRHLPLVHERVKEWVKSPLTYTVRFGIVTLLNYFLDDAFDERDLDMAAGIRSDKYYVKMAVSWYFSMALVKQYDAAVNYFTDKRLDMWTHNKAIQKARESLRIDTETKEYLKTLKI
ncbi:MAG: DNA alkylation repair protein [Lachnospiraceae bacterium]|nr:DNA alkylation repair protein [Lachnospiraceae bacterium]